MTSTILAPNVKTYAFSGGFGFKPTFFRKDNGTLAVNRLAVFRSGTFRDSMGDQFTYEDLHIKQMVENFNYLRNNSLLDDVPVRDGHPGFLINGQEGSGKVIGWHTGITTEKLKAPHDATEYDYIFVDFELTDPDAATKYENGTYRNRSAEVGRYRTNSEAEFWPVYMGFAFVDIPAVEGLKFSHSNSADNTTGGVKYFIMMDKEKSVGDTQTSGTPEQGSGNHSAPATGGSLPFPVSAPHVFSVNGSAVSDFAAVQAHINVLEQFRAEVQVGARNDFVTSLAAANKIAATEVEKMQAFAQKLSPEMFDQWKGTWDNVPASPLFAAHGQTVTNPDNAAQTQQAGDDKNEDQFGIWRATVNQFKLAGLPVEQIKNSASYKNLVAAGQTVNL